MMYPSGRNLDRHSPDCQYIEIIIQFILDKLRYNLYLINCITITLYRLLTITHIEVIKYEMARNLPLL
jgi:hypothetical protein